MQMSWRQVQTCATGHFTADERLKTVQQKKKRRKKKIRDEGRESHTQTHQMRSISEYMVLSVQERSRTV